MHTYDPQLPVLRQMLALSILDKLDKCGFTELPNPREAFGLSRPELAERVYLRRVSEDGRIKVKVFTTVVGGNEKMPLEVRGTGKDAIRICATYTTKAGEERGLVTETRINRIGDISDIVDRMYQRMRSVYRDANTSECCRQCGAPKFVAKSGKKVCAEICWKTDEAKRADEIAFKSKSRRHSRRKHRRRYS